ncbi:DUF6230 family protein [Nonomuraea insulae]|uniref:DUF6230 family protein n=1 Tax=Nonomuraea insulae TaxID=1616787 RepID=A0ABW1CT81_9ACTN
MIERLRLWYDGWASPVLRRGRLNTAVLGRVRWRRFALIFAPAMGLAFVLLGAMSQGVIGASFAVSGVPFKISADVLRAQGLSAYETVDRTKDGKPIRVLVSGIRHAELVNLCETVLLKSAVGVATLKATAGTGDVPATGEHMITDAPLTLGDGIFRELQAGRDASTLDEVAGVIGRIGGFGEQARTFTIRNFRAVGIASSAGTLRLPDLKISILPGKHECF